MSTKPQTHNYEAFMCKKTAAEGMFYSVSLFLSSSSKWVSYLSTLWVSSYSKSLQIFTPFFMSFCTLTDLFCHFFSTLANFLFSDPSPLVSSLSSFPAWRRSWHPGRHVKPWRTGGNKPENSSNLQESSPFTLTPALLCPLIQPWR